MTADARKSEALTDFPGGVVDFDWSHDGKTLAVIANDPERPDGEKEPPQPPPIVIDRYQFKMDFTGLLTDRRQHLYLVDVASRKATQLTAGSHDEYLPAFSPDGRQIAYVTKRGPDPDRHINWDIYVIEARTGAPETQVTRFIGADMDPDWESRPAWSPDGQSIIALVEESRVTHVSRIDLATGRVTPLTSGPRFDFDIAANGRIAVLGGDDLHPYRIEGLTKGTFTFASDAKVNVPFVSRSSRRAA